MDSATAGTQTTTQPHIFAPVEWSRVAASTRKLAPEAFDSNGQVLNLIEGEWKEPGHPRPYHSANDGTLLGTLPMLDAAAARRAVEFAAREFSSWSRIDLNERKRRISECLAGLRENHELLTYLLMWEIGKPLDLAQSDVDRCISGVEWYVENVEAMLGCRKPLGLVSNIASWNYPLSVIVHAVLIQLLCGNAIIAKTPTDGGLYALTVCMALARHAGLPVSLLSGSGGHLSEALVRHHDVACLSFVGGKSSGGMVAAYLYDASRRYMLEMEGVNAYGIWEFSGWDTLANQLKKGFQYGKQRCTAYTRFVVQRSLFPQFLDMYLPVLRSLRFGHPALVVGPKEELPAYDYGPLINSTKAEELREQVSEATAKGAVSVYEGELEQTAFLPNQDTSAYFAPVALMNVPRNCHLYHNEPFGPVDTIVLVDRFDELIAEMNVSNGALVASIACDDLKLASQVARETRAFKLGTNEVRSRGDREEPFGGLGQSWKGCFVGGKYLVEALTSGEKDERLYASPTILCCLPSAESFGSAARRTSVTLCSTRVSTGIGRARRSTTWRASFSAPWWRVISRRNNF